MKHALTAAAVILGLFSLSGCSDDDNKKTIPATPLEPAKPAPAVPVENIRGTEDVRVDEYTGLVTIVTEGQQVWAFRDTSGEELLSQYDPEFSILFDSHQFAKHELFINLYLQHTETRKKERVDIFFDDALGQQWCNSNMMGGINGPGACLDQDTFIATFGNDYMVRKYVDSSLSHGVATGNFFLRMGDSTYNRSNETVYIEHYRLNGPE